ncbi:hypothetical protein [Vibrio owensii]|uniref:hypothetical protein n=1 Tax=Vibrio owensii TaxID=696485 RepID=UPI000596FE08|nr:hypothetical protein [Vibrio owensii]
MSKEILETLSSWSLKGKKPRQFRDYLMGLVNSNRKLPEGSSAQGVNISSIGHASGLGRQGLYSDRASRETLALLQWALENIGVETIQKGEKRLRSGCSPDIQGLAVIIKKKDRCIVTLQSNLLEQKAHNANLTRKIDELEQKLEQLKLIHQYRMECLEIIPWTNSNK